MKAGVLEIEMFANMARLHNDMQSARRTVGSSMGEIERSVSSAKRVLGTLGVGLSVGVLVNKFQQVAVETDKMRGSLQTVTGSVDAAGIAFDNLTQFAKQTPFTLDQSVNAFIKLKALGLDPSERALSAYGNTAAAMGKSMNQMIEAVADASTMEFERLKEFGIKAKQQGDNVSFTFQGVTTTVGKNSKEIQEYLLAIGENQFGDAMANQMERLPGQISNLQDNVDALFRTMADEGGTQLFASGIKTVSGWVETLTEKIPEVVFEINAGSEVMSAAWKPWADDVQFFIQALDSGFDTLFQNVGSQGIGTAEALRLAYGTTLRNILTFTKILTVEVASLEDKFKVLLKYKGDQQQLEAALAGIENARASTIADIMSDYNQAASEFHQLLAGLREGRKEFDDVNNSADETVQVFGELNDSTFALWEEAMIAAGVFERDTTPAIEEMNDKTKALIESLENQLIMTGLSAREQAMFNAELKALATGAGPDAIQQIRELAAANYDAAQATKHNEQAANIAAEAMQRDWERTRDVFSDAFRDMILEGDNAFDSIAKSFEKMIATMIADWMASGIMDLLGITALIGSGSSQPSLSPVSGAASSGITSGLGTVAGAGIGGLFANGGFMQGLFGGSSSFVGPPTATGAMGGQIGAFLTNPWTLGIGALLAFAASNDFWADPDGYKRTNAGFLTAPTPGADPSRTFSVNPFASGFNPIGFNRRGSIADANAVIDQFRFVDQALVEAIMAAGGSIDMSGATLNGVNQDGVFGTQGTFLGMGGRTDSLEDQILFFARQVADHAQGIDENTLAQLRQADSVQEMVTILQETGQSLEESVVDSATVVADAVAESAKHLQEQRRVQAQESVRRTIASMAGGSSGSGDGSTGGMMSNSPGARRTRWVQSLIDASADVSDQRAIAEFLGQGSVITDPGAVRSAYNSGALDDLLSSLGLDTRQDNVNASIAQALNDAVMNAPSIIPGMTVGQLTDFHASLAESLNGGEGNLTDAGSRMALTATGSRGDSIRDEEVGPLGITRSQEANELLADIAINSRASRKVLEKLDQDGFSTRT